jgi:hypothetical protein
VPFAELAESYERFENDFAIGQDRIDYGKLVDKFRVAQIADLKNGLTIEENLELFETADLDRMISLLIKGLAEVCRSRA